LLVVVELVVVCDPVSLFELQDDVCVWVDVVVVLLLVELVLVEHVLVLSAEAATGAISAPLTVPATSTMGTMRRRIDGS
jgi:hypothetical protein